jgi:REP element-mobilizing transposase RayT
VDVPDGWYHVTARGIERRTIFDNVAEHGHFCELLAEMVERFRVVLHAHVELDNHYHLILQTPDANLSPAMQWLNVSYVAWINRRRQRVGPLMQGRFKSIPVENSAWAYALSLYVHLNPVMRKAHGLAKAGKKAEASGWVVPDQATVTHRLAELRRRRWSSYPAYAGYVQAPEWLTTGEILRRAHRRKERRVRKYREDVRQRLAKGVEPELKERLADGFALGTEAFRSRIRQIGKGGREVSGTPKLRARVSFGDVVGAVERLRGEKASEFMDRRGDWGRPLVLWAARRYTGLTLREIGEAAGGMDYTAVAMAIRRFEDKSRTDTQLQRLMARARRDCEK